MADILVIIKPSMYKMDLKLFGIKQPVQKYSESCFSVVLQFLTHTEITDYSCNNLPDSDSDFTMTS